MTDFQGRSIFDLKTNVNQLTSSNEGMTRTIFEEIEPSRPITPESFNTSAIRFKFSAHAQRWVQFDRSYCTSRISITQNDGTILPTAAQLGPAMNLFPCLFRDASFSIQNKVIDKIDDYFPQIDTLENRKEKSKAWLDDVGASTNFWQPDVNTRIAEITSDGVIDTSTEVEVSREDLGFDEIGGGADGVRNSWAYDQETGVLTYVIGTDGGGLSPAKASLAFPVGSYFKYIDVASVPEVGMKVLTNDGAGTLTLERLLAGDVPASGLNEFVRVSKSNSARRVRTFEISWIPPLSIFKVDHAIPAGDFELIFTPEQKSAMNKRIIESLVDKDSTDFKVEVLQFKFWACMTEAKRVDDMVYLLDLDCTSCRADEVKSADYGQKSFDVEPSTYALTVAYQDIRAGSDARMSVSKFKTYNTVGTTSQEMNLKRFSVNFAGQSKPNTELDNEFVDGTDYAVRSYQDSLIQNGGYFGLGGSENLKEFRERGPYYYNLWARGRGDPSTRVSVSQSFHKNAADPTAYDNTRVLLFSHYRKAVRVEIRDGRVIKVEDELQ
jgi:hypothetical protein